MLFSIYNMPSIICPTIAGILCDKYNTTICMVIFVIILNIAQTIFSFGFQYNSYKLALFGRFLLGFCGDALVTSICVILGTYFMNKEQTFSYSLCTTISTFVAVLSYPITLTICHVIIICMQHKYHIY